MVREVAAPSVDGDAVLLSLEARSAATAAVAGGAAAEAVVHCSPVTLKIEGRRTARGGTKGCLLLECCLGGPGTLRVHLERADELRRVVSAAHCIQGPGLRVAC